MTLPFLSSDEYDERARQHYDAGEYDPALAVLQEGLRRFPDAVELLVGMGYVRSAREEYAWARQMFEAALALDAEHEDAWVGLGEVLLKFGARDAALGCFAEVDRLGLGDDEELGLAIGRALYREGAYAEALRRFRRLAAVHPESGEVAAGVAYALHALDDEPGARSELRRALALDPSLHEARIYLAHLLYERGELNRALQELERVPPAEHWDPLSLWRVLDLKASLEGVAEDDPLLDAWRERLAELDAGPDGVDQLLAEVEASFEESPPVAAGAPLAGERRAPLAARPAAEAHRVRLATGETFAGSWDDIVRGMRDAAAATHEPLVVFMRRTAQRVRTLTGRELPWQDAEAFVRASAALGLLRIEE